MENNLVRTDELRFVRRYSIYILQQKWRNGDLFVWRDVPIEKEAEATEANG